MRGRDVTWYVGTVGEGLPVWGLEPEERLVRIMHHLTGERPCRLAGREPPLSGNDRILLARADYLLDERIIDGLVKSGREQILEVDGVHVAMGIRPASLEAARNLLAGQDGACTGMPCVTPGQLASRVSRKLRKVSPPFALRVTPDNLTRIERRLFDEVYKGVTDLVTKWLWPRPAERAVRFCAHHGIRPNHVTALSWTLALLAGILFYLGHFGWGLALGWFMTFLDTVDGKLARVTVDSSRFGHFFDHVLDVVHPPLWYLAWGLGLSSWQPALLKLPLPEVYGLLFAGYVGGRLVEGVFKSFVAGFSIFTWKPPDSLNRLVTARRNPCLILLTLALASGRPDLGFEAVTLWTLISTAFLLIRLGMSVYARARGKPLASWLDQANPETARPWERWFLNRPQP